MLNTDYCGFCFLEQSKFSKAVYFKCIENIVKHSTFNTQTMTNYSDRVRLLSACHMKPNKSTWKTNKCPSLAANDSNLQILPKTFCVIGHRSMFFPLKQQCSILYLKITQTQNNNTMTTILMHSERVNKYLLLYSLQSPPKNIPTSSVIAFTSLKTWFKSFQSKKNSISLFMI